MKYSGGSPKLLHSRDNDHSHHTTNTNTNTNHFNNDSSYQRFLVMVSIIVQYTGSRPKHSRAIGKQRWRMLKREGVEEKK